MVNPLISVIVPVYNVEKYLDKCLDSLVNQTFKNLEIILVNDGSTDNSSIICNNWSIKDNRIKVIDKANGGLSDARNVGIDNSNGEYIVFVDSDDWIDINFISSLYVQIDKYEADIAASTIVKSYDDHEETQPINDEKRVFTSEEAMDTLLSGRDFCAVAWNKLYKRNIIGSIRFPVGKIHEDEFFTYKVIANAKKLILVPEAIYYYRQRTGSIMQKWTPNHLDALEAFKERMDFMNKYYPKLFLKSKYAYFVSIYFNAKELIKYDKQATITEIDKVIKAKKNLKFKISELIHLNVKDVVLWFRLLILIRKLKDKKD